MIQTINIRNQNNNLKKCRNSNQNEIYQYSSEEMNYFFENKKLLINKYS
jgi:hypothetical protein